MNVFNKHCGFCGKLLKLIGFVNGFHKYKKCKCKKQ